MKTIKTSRCITQLKGAAMLIITLGFVECNLPPSFIQNIDLSVISENTPIGTSVSQLIATDPENSPVSYDIEGTDLLRVNPRNGVVSVFKPIDREKVGDSLKFWVSAEDNVGKGHENNKIRVPVTVIILDENDSPPVVSVGKEINVAIKEDIPIGTQIFEEISVTDTDLVGSILQVFCKDCLQLFRIELMREPTTNQLTFAIFLAKQIQFFPEHHNHILNLMISDGAHNTTLKVNITLINVQNKPPVFIGSTTAIISEDTRIGSLVLRVKAIDGDFVDQNSYSKQELSGRPIVYELLTNPENYFNIDSKTGELRVVNQMDKETFPLTNGVLTVVVRATEVDSNSTMISDNDSSTKDLIVTLLDANDEVPSFNHHSFTVSVDENVPNGTPLSSLDMMVQDKDSGSNSAFNIALIDSSGVFSVEPPIATGSTSVSIRVANGPLDYENPNHRKFILLVTATEAFTKEKFSSTSTVTVVINDVNDNAPKFEHETYSATVVENASPGTIITTIQASDIDSGNLLSYSLFGNGADLFYVNPSSGVVTVNQCETPGRGNCLDYESRAHYYLSFQADDGKGLSSVVSLAINVQDANDNAPVFIRDSYFTIIDEFSTKFEPSLKVQATDSDTSSIISYSIISGNAENLFSIETRSGEIKVNRPIQSKYENITLVVQASDGGKGIATVKIRIKIRDRNDNTPVFLKDNYFTTISESLPRGSFVEQMIAKDSDSGINAEIKYKILRGAFEDFHIDSYTGIMRIGNNSKLDFDKRNLYEIQVIAIDRGIPARTGTTTLTVKLLNYNNKDPYFHPTNQRAEVNEAANINTKFYTMKAIDPDVDHSESLRFGIEGASAIDKDGNIVDSSVENRFKDFFGVDVIMGDIFVANKIDRNIAAVVNLNMSVRDVSVVPNQIGFGNLWINIVQYNKFPPVFGKPWTKERPELTFSMRENQPIGTVLTNLIATDKDSKISHYEIMPLNDYFTIDSDSGVITVKQNIDFEKLIPNQFGTTHISFNAISYDSGLPQLSCVANVMVNIVNINDGVPVFNQSSYETTIEENIQWNTLILTVNATDSDLGKYGQISYSLLNNDGNFVIDAINGEIRIAAGANLDREKGPVKYTLQVVATDGGGTDDPQSISVPVYIRIIDTNDCSPQFDQRIYHANVLGHIDSTKAPVIQLKAMDEDEGINGEVSYKIVGGNVNDVFEIDPHNGVIYATASLLSVNENIKEYKLRVEARDHRGDGPFFDETKVHIKVVEMNRNRPKFVVPSVPIVYVEENLPPGIRVIKIEAKDDDKGANGVVRCSFKVGDKNIQENEYFRIDKYTCDIFSKVSFDREAKSEYEIILSAQDEGQPQAFETLQQLTIMIKDIDDNLPQFPQREPYQFRINENSPRGTVIGKVNAVDYDQLTNSIFYYIIDGNANHNFYIEKMTGIIYANATFDREEQESYDLVVKATNDPDLMYYQRDLLYNAQLSVKDRTFNIEDKSLALIKVFINDLNDEEPRFEKTIYRISMNYKSAIGEVVTRVNAIDKDDEQYSSLIYNIAMIDLYRKNQQIAVRPIPSPFNLTNEGHIMTTLLMTQYSIDSRFVLTIEAREKVSPHRMAQTKVHIWLYDTDKLTRITIKLDPETVNAKRDDVEKMLSNATGHIAIISDIKYYLDPKIGKLNKNWSDIYVYVVDGIKEINPTRVIEILDTNGNLHHDTQIIKKISLASASIQNGIEEFDVTTMVLIALCSLLLIGFIATIVSCFCLKSWYTMKLMKQTMKLNKKGSANDILQEGDEVISLHGSNRTFNEPVHERTSESAQNRSQPSIDNPLWTDRSLRQIYEDQELSMRFTIMPDGHLSPSGDNDGAVHYSTLSEGRIRQRQPDPTVR